MTSIALGPDDAAWAIPILASDHGLSEDAKLIRRQVVEVHREMTAGVSITAPHRETLRALQETLAEATESDWDGYGARPVSPSTAVRAHRFVSLLPTTVPPPDVGADPNGRLHFEWRAGPGRAFVVSVGPSDVIHYAALFGRSKAHGTEELSDELPQAVLANLGRALGRIAG